VHRAHAPLLVVCMLGGGPCMARTHSQVWSFRAPLSRATLASVPPPSLSLTAPQVVAMNCDYIMPVGHADFFTTCATNVMFSDAYGVLNRWMETDFGLFARLGRARLAAGLPDAQWAVRPLPFVLPLLLSSLKVVGTVVRAPSVAVLDVRREIEAAAGVVQGQLLPLEGVHALALLPHLGQVIARAQETKRACHELTSGVVGGGWSTLRARVLSTRQRVHRLVEILAQLPPVV
jgi:hypothetical protein